MLLSGGGSGFLKRLGSALYMILGLEVYRDCNRNLHGVYYGCSRKNKVGLRTL